MNVLPTRPLLCVLALGVSLPAAAGDAEETGAALLLELVKLDTQERRKLLAGIPRAEQAKVLAQLPVEELLALGRLRIAELGTYRARLVKEERVDGKLHAPQTMELLIQPAPLAIVAEVSAGPAKGRRFLYNHALRPKDLRVKEPGLLGVAGAVWIGIDSRMTRRDTRHPVTNLGYEPVMRMIQEDFEKARGAGGFARVDEGFDARGGYCMLYTAPKAAQGLYARKSRICLDPADALPTRIEVWDDEGLLERLAFELKEASVKVTGAALTPAGAGL